MIIRCLECHYNKFEVLDWLEVSCRQCGLVIDLKANGLIDSQGDHTAVPKLHDTKQIKAIIDLYLEDAKHLGLTINDPMFTKLLFELCLTILEEERKRSYLFRKSFEESI